MTDRQPTKAGRVLITPEDGSTPYYAVMTMADEPTHEGSAWNKANVLPDTLASQMGITKTDPQVADALEAAYNSVLPAGSCGDVSIYELPRGICAAEKINMNEVTPNVSAKTDGMLILQTFTTDVPQYTEAQWMQLTADRNGDGTGMPIIVKFRDAGEPKLSAGTYLLRYEAATDRMVVAGRFAESLPTSHEYPNGVDLVNSTRWASSTISLKRCGNIFALSMELVSAVAMSTTLDVAIAHILKEYSPSTGILGSAYISRGDMSSVETPAAAPVLINDKYPFTDTTKYKSTIQLMYSDGFTDLYVGDTVYIYAIWIV